jgi:hypothetical protein
MSDVTFTGSVNALDAKRLIQTEKLIGIEFPNDYRSFLLKHNGGRPSPAIFQIQEVGEEAMVDILYGIGTPQDICFWLSEFGSELPTGFVPIGQDPGGNVILMNATAGEDSGIYYWDAVFHFPSSSAERNTYLIASTFTDFLLGLHDIES